MAILTAQLTIPHDSAIPEDVVINTFHFLTSPGANDFQIQSQMDAIPARIQAFYNNVHAPGSVPLKTYLGSTLNPPAATLKIYNRSDPTPRAPRLTVNPGLGSGATNSLPHELAICLSYQAERLSGKPQTNRRGRLFLGPFSTSTNDSGSGRALPTLAVRQAIAGAASTLATLPTGGADWAVYSRVLNEAYIVTDGWVDDAWDIQRRRGERATSRLLWT